MVPSIHCMTYRTELYTLDFYLYLNLYTYIYLQERGTGRFLVVFAFTRGLVEIEACVPGVRAQLGRATWHLHPLPLVEDGRAALVVHLHRGRHALPRQGLQEKRGTNPYFPLRDGEFFLKGK